MRYTFNMSEQQLRFFASTPSSCGYLPDRDSVSLFADPDFNMTPALYSHLINHGFRRSGEFVYRPYCSECNACLPVRILADQFKPSRKHRRIWKKNQDLTVRILDSAFNQEHVQLYVKYIQARHTGGSMDDPDPDRYQSFMHSHWCETDFIEFRLDQKLVGLAVTDRVRTGVSAFYTFFDPDLARRSLGTYAILWQIQYCQDLGLPYVFLGYWIAECDKMSYKSEFQRQEIWIDEHWLPFEQAHKLTG